MQEVVFDLVRPVPEADNEVGVPEMRVILHHMPKHRTIADGDKGFRDIVAVLAQPCPQAATEKNHFHSCSISYLSSPLHWAATCHQAGCKSITHLWLPGTNEPLAFTAEFALWRHQAEEVFCLTHGVAIWAGTAGHIGKYAIQSRRALQDKMRSGIGPSQNDSIAGHLNIKCNGHEHYQQTHAVSDAAVIHRVGRVEGD